MQTMDANARQLRRRLRAARELAGFENMEDLVKELDGEHGFGRATLYGLEQGTYTNPPGPAKLTRIAEACGVDVAWFYVDIHAAVRSAGGGLSASDLAKRSAGATPEAPPGAFGQSAEGSEPNDPHHHEADSDQEADDPPDNEPE